MAQVIVSLTESPAASGGAPTDVGTLFAAGATDQGPDTPVLCRSLTEYTNAFGPRSTVSSDLYDTAEFFFARGGGQGYFLRVTDDTATSASLTLQDATPHPTVVVTALSPGVDGNDIYVAVTSSAVEIEDADGDVLESWPFSGTNAELLAADSAYVTFTQSSGSGFTTAVPAPLSATALSGGTNPSDLDAASYAGALASFAPNLGPGTVTLPGQTSGTCAVALFEHAVANNRFAVADMEDAATSTAAISALDALDIPASASKAGIVVQGSPIVPTSSGAPKTVPGSAAVAALRAQVAATGANPPAAFAQYGALTGINGFTTAYANDLTQQLATVSWSQSDANAMTDAGVCFFGSEYGTLCLDEFVTPDVTDNVFFQATAWTAAMMLVSQCQAIGAEFKGSVIDGAGTLVSQFHGDLAAIVQTLYGANVLYGDDVQDAASINTAPPVNTDATAQAGQLKAQLAVRLSPYADQIDIAIDVLSLTQSVGASS